jgi:hypothetical protein
MRTPWALWTTIPGLLPASTVRTLQTHSFVEPFVEPFVDPRPIDSSEGLPVCLHSGTRSKQIASAALGANDALDTRNGNESHPATITAGSARSREFVTHDSRLRLGERSDRITGEYDVIRSFPQPYHEPSV